MKLAYSARTVALLAILFVSLFALDAVDPGSPLGASLSGLAVHLIPTFVLAVALGIAWRYELLGGILFILIAFVPFLTLSNAAGTNFILATPFLVAGALFILSARQRAQGA